MADADGVLMKFAQRLAGNEKKIRDRALKKLKKWISVKSASQKGFLSADMLKIWKGLHYCMWMSDKPLVQEDLAHSIAAMIHCFATFDSALLFVDTFFQTECREWPLIDQLRLDKFLMMVRHVFKQSLVLLNKKKWNKEIVANWLRIFTTQLLNPKDDKAPTGLKFHVIDIYLDEIAEAGAAELSSDQIQMLLEPYYWLIATTKNVYLCDKVEMEIFRKIISQVTSQYQEAKDLANGTVVDENEEDCDASCSHLTLKYDVSSLTERLFALGSSKQCVGRNRRKVYALVTIFENMKQGIYPMEDPQETEGVPLPDLNIEDAVKRLAKFERALMKKTGKIKRKYKRAETAEDEESSPPKKICKDLETRESLRNKCLKSPSSKLRSKSQQKPTKGEDKGFTKQLDKRLAEDNTSNTTETVENPEKQQKSTKLLYKNSTVSVKEAGSTPKVSNEEITENGEVEIWIPNKKYQKKHKERHEQFIKFTPDARIPQALYRRSATRIGLKKQRDEKEFGKTPHSEPTKRVSFSMDKNLTHGFDHRLSTTGTFDPNATPEQSILKAKHPGKRKPKTLFV